MISYKIWVIEKFLNFHTVKYNAITNHNQSFQMVHGLAILYFYSFIPDGEILVSALYLSVDPYMRSYVGRMNPPFTMIGQNVSKVIESRHADYPVGCILVTNSGWIKTGS